MANMTASLDQTDCNGTGGCVGATPGVTSGFLATVVFEDMLVLLGLAGNVALFALMRRERFSQYSFAVYFSFSAVFDSWMILSGGILDSSEAFFSFDIPIATARVWRCPVLFIFEFVPATVCPWLIVALTVDRLISICYPQYAIWYCTQKKALFVCIVTICFWVIYGIVFSMYDSTHMIEEDERVDYICTSKLHGSEIFYSFTTLMTYQVPLVLIFAMSTAMLWNLRKHHAYAFLREDERSSLMTEKNKVERMNGIIFYVLVASLLTWLPFSTVSMMDIFHSLWDTSSPAAVSLDKAWHATLVVYMVTYVQNFYVMMTLSPMLRFEFRKMVKKSRCSRQQPSGPSSEDVGLAEYGTSQSHASPGGKAFNVGDMLGDTVVVVY